MLHDQLNNPVDREERKEGSCCNFSTSTSVVHQYRSNRFPMESSHTQHTGSSGWVGGVGVRVNPFSFSSHTAEDGLDKYYIRSAAY